MLSYNKNKGSGGAADCTICYINGDSTVIEIYDSTIIHDTTVVEGDSTIL